jgi:hypothetical protein
MSDAKPMRMDAYYYGFEPTGEECIDRVLSAVACAGKAYHNTSEWAEESEHLSPYEPFQRGATCQDWIQNAAIDATAEVTRLRQALGEALDGWAGRDYDGLDVGDRRRIRAAFGMSDDVRTLASKETT